MKALQELRIFERKERVATPNYKLKVQKVKHFIPCPWDSRGVAGTLSPLAVSPYVLAGEGSYSDTCFTCEADNILSIKGTATLEVSLLAPSMGLFGVAGG